MVEVGKRVNFEDTALHQPEFLDIHEVLQAASHPSVETLKRYMSSLSSPGYSCLALSKSVTESFKARIAFM